MRMLALFMGISEVDVEAGEVWFDQLMTIRVRAGVTS